MHKYLKAIGISVLSFAVFFTVIPTDFSSADTLDSDAEIHLRGFVKTETLNRIPHGFDKEVEGFFRDTFVYSAVTPKGYAEGECPPMMVDIRQPSPLAQDVEFDLNFVANRRDKGTKNWRKLVEDLEIIETDLRLPFTPDSLEEMEETGESLASLDGVYKMGRRRAIPVEVTGPFSTKKDVPANDKMHYWRYHVSIPDMPQGQTQVYFCPRLTDEAHVDYESYILIRNPETKETIRLRRSEIEE